MSVWDERLLRGKTNVTLQNASQRSLRFELFPKLPGSSPSCSPHSPGGRHDECPSGCPSGRRWPLRQTAFTFSSRLQLIGAPARMLAVAVDTVEYPRVWKQHLGLMGLFSASYLFSWILQTEQLTENNRYVQLLIHLGNGGAVPVDVHHEPFQRRRGGFKWCQLCQSDNWHQSTSLGFLWLHVWSAVISNVMIVSLIVGCVAFLFAPPSSSSVVRVVFVFAAILHRSRLLTCLPCAFHRQHQRSKTWQDPTWKPELAAV